MNTVNYAARRESAENLPKGQRLRLAHPRDRAAAAEDRKDQTGTHYWARGNQLALALVGKVDPHKRGVHAKIVSAGLRIVNKGVAQGKLKVERHA